MTAQSKRVVGYFANWTIYRDGFTPEAIPAHQLTHINYAFLNLANDKGDLVFTDTWADIEKPWPGDNDSQPFKGNIWQLTAPNGCVKKKNPNIKILFSVGGWTLSEHFSNVAKNEEASERFASQITYYIRKYGFDGVGKYRCNLFSFNFEIDYCIIII